MADVLVVFTFDVISLFPQKGVVFVISDSTYNEALVSLLESLSRDVGHSRWKILRKERGVLNVETQVIFPSVSLLTQRFLLLDIVCI